MLALVLPRIGAALPLGTGESAEIADTGGLHTRVLDGPCAGLTPNELVERYGAGAVLGEAASRAGEREFPLMLKFLDTAANLSVQVHPHDVYDKHRLVARGKSEAWVVLRAAPGAVIYQGVRRGIAAGDFWNALGAGRVADTLEPRTVAAGDALVSPAGMVHAIGAGLVLAELQQNSNVTFRAYDWPDTPGVKRELHLAEFRRWAKPELARPPILRAWHDATDDTSAVTLCQGPPFTWIARTLKSGARVSVALNAFRIVSCIAGDVRLCWHSGESMLEAGDTRLVPAACARIELIAHTAARVLEATA